MRLHDLQLLINQDWHSDQSVNSAIKNVLTIAHTEVSQLIEANNDPVRIVHRQNVGNLSSVQEYLLREAANIEDDSEIDKD
jgi:hypothetical protein